MHHVVRSIFVSIIGFMSLTTAAKNSVQLALSPENPVAGQQIAAEFNCSPDASNFDDVDRTKTRVRFESTYLRIDYYRFRNAAPTAETCTTTAHIGGLPMGTYPLKLYMHFTDDADPQGVLVHEGEFTVSDFVSREGDQRPLHDFSGAYWNPSRSGESITVAQSYGTNQVGMLFNVFGADSKATWHYFVSTRWVTPNMAEGHVYRVQGKNFLDTSNSTWTPVNILEVGQGTVEFGGILRLSKFDLTIDGVPVSRSFQAFRY